MQTTFTARAEVTPDTEDGLYRIALMRVIDGRHFPLVNLAGQTAASVYTTTGIKVAVPPARPEDPIAAAKSILREALDNLPTSGVVSRDTVVDAFLDSLSELGYEKEEIDGA